MVARALLLRQLRHANRLSVSLPARCYAQKVESAPQPPQPKKVDPSPQPQPQQHQSWLTRKIKSSPRWRKLFFQFTNLLGYGSPKQVAGRRAFFLYERVVAVTPDADTHFWQQGAIFSDFFISSLTSCRMSSSADFPVLVHCHKSPHMDAHSPSSFATRRQTLHPGPN